MFVSSCRFSRAIRKSQSHFLSWKRLQCHFRVRYSCDYWIINSYFRKTDSKFRLMMYLLTSNVAVFLSAVIVFGVFIVDILFSPPYTVHNHSYTLGLCPYRGRVKVKVLRFQVMIIPYILDIPNTFTIFPYPQSHSDQA